MKKNMLTVLILILTLVNVSLTAFAVFIVVPNAQRTDELITKCMQIIDLELESPVVSQTATGYDIVNVKKYNISEITANLKKGDDGKDHFAVVNCSVAMDSAHADYEKLNPLVESYERDIVSIIKNKLITYTKEELENIELREALRTEILAEIRQLFGSAFVVDFVMDMLLS